MNRAKKLELFNFCNLFDSHFQKFIVYLKIDKCSDGQNKCIDEKEKNAYIIYNFKFGK